MTAAAESRKREPGIVQSGMTLAAVAAVCTTLVALTHYATSDRIAANAQAHLEASLAPVIGEVPFDNTLADSEFVILPPHELPGNERVTAYRATLDGNTVAVLFNVTAPDGFSGPIRILIGVAADRTVTGVRVIEHRETAGLGDQIEVERSDWILQFDGTSLNSPARAAWSIQRDGGVFDQMTGASVTSRAVVKAISRTLEYVDAGHAVLFGTEEQANDSNE